MKSHSIKLPQLPQDKAHHFIHVCVICYLADFKFSAIVCLLVVVIVAILKEVWDYYHKGKVEVLDAGWRERGRLFKQIKHEL